MHDYYPLGKISLQTSTTGIANSPDMFQQKKDDLFHGFEFIHSHIDELLMSTKEDWKYHVQKLELTINKLKK